MTENPAGSGRNTSSTVEASTVETNTAETCIVVPCYNEAQRLDRAAFLDFSRRNARVRLLMIDDGSTDDTLAVLDELKSASGGRIQVLALDQNGGKAEAVRRGMLAAFDQGCCQVGFFDADLATPLEALPEFERAFDAEPDVDIVLGARVALLGRSINRRPLRHYLGRLFATVASLVLGLPVYDTQCGAKLFRGSSRNRRLFEEPFASRWIFDVEFLARYLDGGGTQQGLYELPLRRWRDVGESRVSRSDFFRAIVEMGGIYRRYRMPLHARLLRAWWYRAVRRRLITGAVGAATHLAILVVGVEALGILPAAAAATGAMCGGLITAAWRHSASSRPGGIGAQVRSAAMVPALVSGVGVWLLTSPGTMHYLWAQLLVVLACFLAGVLPWGVRLANRCSG